MLDFFPNTDVITADITAGAADGILTPSGFGIHDAIEKLFFTGSYESSSKPIELYGCGCYDGEGYTFFSPYADPSSCLINGIFVNLLSAMLILGGLSKIYKLRKQKNIKSKSQIWFPLKLALIVAQIVFQFLLVIATANHSPSYTVDIKFWSSFVNLIGLIVALLLTYIENFKTYVSSTVLIVNWSVSVILGGLRVVNFLLRGNKSSLLHLTVFTTINSLILSILEINCQPVAILDPTQKFNIYDHSNIYSKLTFSWLSPLMAKGYKQFLLQVDLPPLPSFLRSDKLAATLSSNWNNERNFKKRPSLSWALAKSFGGPFIVAGFFKFTQDVIAFVQPQLLKHLIRFVNEYNEDKTIPLTRGFMIVASMFFLSVFQTGALHQYFLRVFDMGIKIRSSLTSLIYQKSLVLSVEAKQKSSTGDIVNLMSVDTQRLQDLCQNLQILWSGPFQITLCLVSLYNLLGNAMWLGVAFLVVSVPLNTLIFRQQRNLQKKQMKVKDERTGLISEILNNIKSLKLYAWEAPYKAKLMHVRNDKELANLKKIGIFQAAGQFIFNSTPYLVSCSTFAVFISANKGTPLSTDIVFTALALFNLLGFPLAVLPWTIGGLIEGQVAVKRLTDFLTTDELEEDSINKLPASKKIGEPGVVIESADFLWSRDPYKVALTDVNFKANKGELNCIIGRVGSGKSSLMQAMLGDLHKTKGMVFTYGSIAYVSQIPWIMNGTIKENILFGCTYDPIFYEKTIRACALTPDLSVLPDGDSTQVGEKGISLSGGQKARLSLARAVYARADVYLLDDILSAVDEHVGKHLINNVLGPDGLLHSKCRVLATNNLNVLRYSDHISMMSNGRIAEQGDYTSIVHAKSGTQLSNLINEFGTSNTNNNSKSTKSDDLVETVLDKDSSETYSDDSSDLDEEIKKTSEKELKKAEAEDFESYIRLKEAQAETGREEKHEQGEVKTDIYLAYARACGFKSSVFLVVVIAIAVGASVLGNIWLKHWSDINTREGYNPQPWRYLGIYFALCIGSAFAILSQTLVQWLLVSIQGSKYLHQIMLDSVLRAPMQFFETTPVGRVLNRFSNDIYKIDENLCKTFSMFFSNTIKVSFTILVIVYSTWQFIFMVIPLTILYRFYQRYYLATSRELRRLDSVSKSPIFAHFQETLSGVATIRAYDQLDRFTSLNKYKMDVNMSAYHPSVSANRWLAVRLEFLGSLIILGASGLLILTLKSGKVTPGLVGLSVSYALQVTQSLNWIVRMTVDIESNIVSVERVIEYAELDHEAELIIENKRPATNWPFNGTINFKNYSTKYRPELDMVLKNINLSIQKKEKIGIVGRTGAGKSSLTLAIFRMIEAYQGNIDIDEVDTSEIGLYDLRSKLSIIPQDSQIFEGTLRSNLDPVEEYSDQDLWDALELSHLKDHIISMYNDVEDKETISNNPLLNKIAEGGSNLSVGQRQLMCLARALVKKNSKILILDEATANVDIETDSIVQETIRTAFEDRTILTIAHRLNTIIDSDKILVLEKGEVAEFDTPENLLKKKDSLFYSLCKEGGLVPDDEE
ncbi:hypothetical protein CANARDRAFT_8901 [[Candida] arabinofermentans NRRL YB-2248]|uniref:Metal resistance protein YCF1 n=1 Tax=[Candida] arabinofermentans NRRL YB-2248 TaxID=983967 RepID=A0A1E4SXL5_9ASCO|nr:hypothetical protein CANARDRAFT_8901 [[Candida] arabinofermentans NRRL YB-2248]